MASGFGADPTLNAAGAVVVGTTSADIRKIFGALYSPGLISGGVVKTSATAMTYSVSEGVAAIPMAGNEVVLGYFPAVANLPATSTALPRTDYVYAYQQTPGVDKDSNLRVEVSSTMPTNRAVILGTYTYKAGATKSNDGVLAAEVDYSVPYGTSRGEISWAQNTLNGTFGDSRTVIISRSVHLPTDRLVSFSFQTVLSAADAYRFGDSTYCEASYILKVDNEQVAFWRTPGLHQAWSTMYFEVKKNLSAGAHTITLDRARNTGPGMPFQHYGSGSSIGASLSVVDLGVIR